MPRGTEGAICIKLPLPPGTLPTLWGDDERFVASYLSAFDGYYLTGDGGYVDEDGYLFVMGRTDDVINVAGHRLSTGVDGGGARRAPGGRRVRGDRRARRAEGPGPARARGAQGRASTSTRTQLRAELVQRVRDEIGAVAAFRAGRRRRRRCRRPGPGKILRRTMRGIADGVDEPVPSTIEDPAVLDALRPVLQDLSRRAA